MKTELMEIQEALAEGEKALDALGAAKEQLNSALNWGVFDMFAGGFFSSMMKHKKVDVAVAAMEEAKYHLQAFQRELKDVNMNCDLNLDIGSFLSFADFFFDGVLVDYLVQNKIKDAAFQVDDAIELIKPILFQLKQRC